MGTAPDQVKAPAMRIAGVPISWGVVSVPGWGHEVSRDRMLAEMQELSLVATGTAWPAPGLVDTRLS